MLRILGTVALLTIGGELPAFAQAAIQEPGAYAFYHPNADVLGPGRPSVRSIYPMSAFASSAYYRGYERVYGATASNRTRSLLRATIPRSTKNHFAAFGAEFGVSWPHVRARL
jgi:hypothetical protein